MREKEWEIRKENVWGDENVKRMRKVGESVNVKKKKEYNLMSTIFFYLNLSKILHFLFFKTKREKI